MLFETFRLFETLKTTTFFCKLNKFTKNDLEVIFQSYGILN